MGATEDREHADDEGVIAILEDTDAGFRGATLIVPEEVADKGGVGARRVSTGASPEQMRGPGSASTAA